MTCDIEPRPASIEAGLLIPISRVRIDRYIVSDRLGNPVFLNEGVDDEET